WIARPTPAGRDSFVASACLRAAVATSRPPRMTAPTPPPSPDARAAARWRAVAISLAVACAFLSGLLLLSLGTDPMAKDADAGAKDASAEASDEADKDADKKGRIEGTVMLSGAP